MRTFVVVLVLGLTLLGAASVWAGQGGQGPALALSEQTGSQSPLQAQALDGLLIAAGLYHGNIKSGVFHRQGCRWFDCKNCTAAFATREDALRAGFRPCKVCRP